MGKKKGSVTLGLASLGLIIALVVAWITHIVHCLTAAKYVLLLVGALVAPVGIIHGVGLWFGFSW